MDLELKRDDLHETRVVDSPPAPLEVGEARLAVRRFGFSANNVTYAVFGDLMGYWTFFTDASPHRAGLPSAYNGYTRCASDPVYDPATEPLQMLLRPLFMTDFVLDDWLADNGFFGAGDGTVVLSSASSKTAFGLAHLLSRRADRPEVVGLTSAGNVAFVEGLGVDGLGVYDRLVTYDDIASLPADAPSVYVDMAGDAGVRKAVHEHMTGLAASVQVGGTHWEQVSGSGDLPGPAPSLFFAPDQIVKRRADWGPGGVESRFAEAWAEFLPVVQGWIEVVERRGPDAVADTYREVLGGRADPSVAFVLSMDEA